MRLWSHRPATTYRPSAPAKAPLSSPRESFRVCLIAAAAAAVGSLLILASTAHSQSTWDAGGDGLSWSDPANWNPDGVPDENTDVLLDGGASIELDVTASAHDLELSNATLDGPGDLLVTGQMNWALGTVTGTGVLTTTGGLAFLEGSDKIIGRPVEVACDATWEDSHILFDIENGGALHHAAGFLFAIVHSEEQRSGSGPHSVSGSATEPDFGSRPDLVSGSETNSATGRSTTSETRIAEFTTPSGQRVRAAHRGAPLIGGDTTADNTDVYVFSFDGTLFAETTTMFEVSTDIRFFYDQNGGSTLFGSGSRLLPGAFYSMGDGTEVVFDEGTHIAQGEIEAAEGASPLGMSTTGDQTVFIVDPEGIRDTPFALRGPHSFGENVVISAPLTVQAETTLSGSSQTTLTELNVLQSSIELLTLQGLQLAVETMRWEDGQIRLEGGSSLDVQDLIIDQTSTNLELAGDGDPSDIETVTVTRNFDIVRSGEVPPRSSVPMDMPQGLRFSCNDDFVFREDLIFGAEIEINENCGLLFQAGLHTLQPTAQVTGPGAIEIESGATVVLQQPSELVSNVVLRGILQSDGDNTYPDMKAQVDGGTIQGSGGPDDRLAAQFDFSPESSVRRAQVKNVEVSLEDGSGWTNGHIDFKEGATGVVPAGATFVVDHTATNLQITEDADGGTEEKLIVDGQVTVDQTPSVPPSWNVPTEVSQTGKFVVEAGQNVNVPNVMTVRGGLQVREGAGARFTFVDSRIAPEGTLSGNGTITQALNGDLLLDGTVSPGDAPGEAGTLRIEGTANFGASSTTVLDFVNGEGPTQSDFVMVDGLANLLGRLRGRLGVPSEVPEQFIQIASYQAFTGGWTEVNGIGFSTFEVDYTSLAATVRVIRAPDFYSVCGSVTQDIDLDGRDSEDPGIPDIEVELILDSGNGPVLETTTTDANGEYKFHTPFEGSYLVRALPDSSEYVHSASNMGSKIVTLIPDTQTGFAFFSVRRPFETIEVTNLEDDGPGSLRNAIVTGNVGEAPFYRIDFGALAGKIIIRSPLPRIRKITTLAYSPEFEMGSGGSRPGDSGAGGRGTGGPGAGGDERLTIDGSDCPGCDGLVLAGGESTVSGLDIENFDGYGIVVENFDLNYISDIRMTGNGTGGILVRSGNRNHIGSGSNGQPNEITANAGPGIVVLDGADHDLRGNSIFGNDDLAIDLGGDGPTPNDFRDTDAGPNGLQNAPVLTGGDPLGLSVQGTLESRPLAEYVVEIYGSETCPESDQGDLQVLLGSGLVMTDADGLVDFEIETTPYAGELSAIATSSTGATSEVSPCFMSVVTDAPVAEGILSFSHRAFPNPSPGPTSLSFRMPHGGAVEASLHDVTGRRLVTIFEGDLPAGLHEIDWDGNDDRGRPLDSGVYFYTLKVAGEKARGRIVTLR